MSEYPDPFAMQPSLLAQIEEAKTRGLSLASVVQDRETAQVLGWSQNLVADNRDEAGNLVAKQAIEQSDLFKSWAAENMEKAAIAREDYAALSQSFHLLEAERKRQALLTWGERKGIQFERGMSSVWQNWLGFWEGISRESGSKAGRFGERFRRSEPPSVPEEEKVEMAARSEANAQELLASLQASVEDMPAPLLDPSFFEDVVEQTPQVLMQVAGAAAGTLLTGPVGGFAASMGLMTPQIMGGTYARLTDEGVSHEHAFSAGMLNAALQAPLESLGIGRALAPFWSKGWKAVVKATGLGALTEGSTEFLQAFPEDFTYLLAHANERGDGEWLQQFVDRLGETAGQGLYEGAIGAVFGLFGGAGRISYEAAHAARAGQFREQMREFYQSFEKTKVKHQAPDIAQGIMEYGGLGRDVYVDADQARTYYQTDPAILEVLDVTEEQLNEAVALGQDLPVNLARITAYAKDSGQFDAVINMTRDVPYAETVAEINREGRDREQVERIIDTLKAYEAAENEVATELARIETEIAEALSGADPAQKHLAVNRESVRVAARQNVQLIAAAMRRFYPDPAKRVEALKGLRGENPDSIATQMEAENERLRREFRKLPLAERNPLLGHIQRRLDLASLRELTDAATIKELQRKLPFLAKSKAKGGLAIDVLADELVTRGFLPEGSGASELLSYLQDVDLNGAFEGKTLYQVAPPVESEAFKKWFGNSKVVDENGKPLIVYHGTARPDRVGEKFDPRRATSGPMAFFTTDPEIGSNYAMGKQDTSLAYDEPNAGMYENWFRVKVGRGKPISIDKAWYRLSDEEQSKIKKLASRVTEEDGEIILADEGHTNGIGNYEWEIKQHRGNAAAALVEGWLNSGTLYDSERDFFKVLKLAGFDMDKITYHSPYETSPAVFPVYLSIQNPLDTASIDSRVVEDLETASKKARQKKSNDADSWDKNSISPRDWMSGLREDIANGTTLSWTRIPDWVTNTLKSLGYDGIKDTGGKYHNVQHGVWIPFQPEQIKSVYNRGTFDPSDPRILYQTQQSEHAAKVREIQTMPAQKVTPGAPLDKKAAENLARSFGKMENKRDHRVAELPVVTVGKILRNKGYDVSTIMADIPELYENAILGWSEEETLRDGHKLHNNIAAYHNYVNKFTGADGKEYYIRFTITERNAPAGKKGGPSFIHSTAISDVTIYENADTEARLRLDNPVVSSESAFVDKKLQHFFDSVKTPTGKTYAQALRGATTILPEGYLISLFSRANLSTLPHELGHIFENELRKIVASGAADASLTTDVAILDNWLSFLDNDENLRVEYDKWLKHQSYEGQDFNEFWPWDLEEMRDRAKREYFARGFEVYLMEGRAPSEGMRGVFERFKRWLLDIYKQAAGLGVELNDEVRGVFDRMLAAEVEVNEAADLNNLLPIPAGVLEDLGVSPTDRENINLLLDTAKERAAAEAVQARNEGRNKRIQQYRDEAKKELLKNPVYAARAELRKEGGYLNAASVIAEFGEDMVKELNRRLPGSVRKDGGRDLKVLAAELGFVDATEMVSKIVSVKPLGKRIDEIVRERMARHDSEVVDPAEHLLKAPETAQQMALLGHWLTNKLKQETQAVAVAQRAIEAAAAETLSKETMKRGTSPYRYLAAMRRALQRQNTALKNKDYPEALRANTQARLNLELSKQAMRLSETTGRVFKELKRFTGMAKTSPAARYAVNFLAAKHGLMRLDEAQAANKNMQTISDWYRDMEADGYPIVFDEALFGGEASDWRDMSVDEFMALTQEITTIITVERNQRHLLTAKGKMDFREAIDGAVRSMLAANKAKPVSRVGNKAGGFIKQGLQKVHAAHMKIEVLLRILDGKDLGENWELIYKPISDAENRRGQLAKEFEERLQEIVSVYSEQERRDMARKPEFEEAIGEAVTKEKRIMVALNMGNEGNLERMVNGNGLSHAEIQRLVAPLTKKDWDFVANIWALFEKYKPMAFDLHERVTGVRPSEVEARPFNIQTADNQFIRVPGGYFPVVYDQARMDPKLKEKIERSRMPAVASTKKGHLKERTAVGAGAPLKFELGSINRAFADVISDMAFREALIDVGRVLRNKEYRAAVQSVAGEEMYRAMVDWLVDVAEVRKPSQVGEGLARWARSNVSVMSMGWKATTALAQPMGITQSIDRLGATYVMQGVKEAYGGGIRGFKEKAAWVRSVSSFMDTRMETFDRDMNDALEDFNNVQLTPGTLLDAITPRKLKEFERWMKKTAFKPIAYMQFGVDLPTWLGAYDKGMKDYDGNHDKAKDYADYIVRITQGSGEAIDLAKIQRGNEYLKMFTMFYSYFNTLYGLIALRANDVNMNMDQASAMRAATSFLLLVALPATFTEIMAGRGPDDDEKWWVWAAKEITMYPAMSVVGLRDVARFVDGQFGYDMSPAESAPESIFKLLRETLRVATDPEKFDLEKMGKLVMQAYGYSKGLPLKQVEISLFNIIDYINGTTGDFELRDLVFTKPQSRR